MFGLCCVDELHEAAQAAWCSAVSRACSALAASGLVLIAHPASRASPHLLLVDQQVRLLASY